MQVYDFYQCAFGKESFGRRRGRWGVNIWSVLFLSSCGITGITGSSAAAATTAIGVIAIGRRENDRIGTAGSTIMIATAAGCVLFFITTAIHRTRTRRRWQTVGRHDSQSLWVVHFL